MNDISINSLMMELMSYWKDLEKKEEEETKNEPKEAKAESPKR